MTKERDGLWRWRDAMASNDEIEEELASIEAILIEGLLIERRPEDGRPKSVTFQVIHLQS